MREPTSEQVAALRRFHAVNGRAWKSHLNHAWMTGRYADHGAAGDASILQQVRNCFGPSWLVRFKFPPVVTRTTEPGKVYVIQHVTGKMYLTDAKGKSGGHYWGLYIGTADKRYGAVRFNGGESTNTLLAGNAHVQAVEVKA